MAALDPARKLEDTEVGRIFREEFGRSLAALIRVFGDVDLAEDAVQEAFEVALARWPLDGLPPNPGGWITITARNRAIDRLRRESRGRELLQEATMLSPNSESDPSEEMITVEDERLRLIFMCCHPALFQEAQVALTLRLLGGLSTGGSRDPFWSPSERWPNAWSGPSGRSRPPGFPTACPTTTSSPTASAPLSRSST